MSDKPDESNKEPLVTSKTAATESEADKEPVSDKVEAKPEAAAKKKARKKSAANKVKTKPTTASNKEDHNKPADDIAETKGPVIKNKRMGGAAGRRTDDKVMPGLLQNLQGVFDKIYHDNRDHDRARDIMTRDFNVHLQRTFKSMHEELEEREKILDRKLKSIDSSHSYEIKRVKLMSVPIMFLTLVAIIYLFYVVRVMETAMSSMSQDMKHMTDYMAMITKDTRDLSINTGSMVTSVNEMNAEIGAMNDNVSNLNTTVNNMMVDVHHMTRTVAPAMQGINRFLP